jgi:hypothetical protein
VQTESVGREPVRPNNIGDGLFQLDARNLYVGMNARSKVIGFVFEEHADQIRGKK